MYQKVENRALFKKSSAARDKLMQMGGVQQPPQGGGLGGMAPPPMPQGGPQGIMASSPDLMQAAMRKAPVLPKQQPMPGQMMPAPPPPMPEGPRLPPSQPMPNIAGIAPVPTNQAPQPKKPVKKMQDGGAVDLGHYDSPLLRKKLNESKPGTTFKDAVNTAQKAITSENPETLGVPKELQEGMRQRKELMQKDPDAAGQAFVNDNLTPEETTGDLKDDLKKVATKSGVTDIPASATVDQLNTAIAGAKLGAAIAGNYVNPATGQAVRPTAGARIGQAVAEGLAVKRDTAMKREAADQAMALQRLKNAGKTTKPPKRFLDSEEGKAMLKALSEVGVERASNPELIRSYMTDTFGEALTNRFFQELQASAAGGQPTPSSSSPSEGKPKPTSGASPSLEEFVTKAQKLNPDYSVEQITAEYNKRYGKSG